MKSMVKKLLYLICILQVFLSMGQECPKLTRPLNGSADIPVTTAITWDAIEGVPGYIISLGTTPGGTDIIAERSVGSATSFIPPLGLPDNSQIYVTLTLFFFNQPNITCPSESFRTIDVLDPPPCTTLRNPVNGAINVSTANYILWNYAPTATNYRLSIGTSAGATDLFDNQAMGNVLSYNPPSDLPSDTEIFVTVTPFNENGESTACQEQHFTTGALASLPGCTNLESPLNGDTNVPLTPFLEWTAVPEATGYRVTIGNSPFTAEILENVTFTATSTLVIDFEANRTFFVTIIPFNAAGEAIGCSQESFSTVLGCGPFFDVDTGALVTLNPEINFPDVVSFCQNDVPFTLTSNDTAEGYRWFRVDQFGDETLLSEKSSVNLTENGEYRYEAYNTVPQSNGTLECHSSKNFNVVSSEIATISALNITGQGEIIRIEVETRGIGDYEYALDSPDGPYQDSDIFENVATGPHTVFVRDKNGCGIVQKSIEQDLTLEGFPKFFTPNGDGINDLWQFIPPPASGIAIMGNIEIFDRFGTLLVQIDPASLGWDGNYQGKPLQASDYWFRAMNDSHQQLMGHFALKR